MILTDLVNQTSDFLISIIPIFGAVAAVIAIYRFFIKQPALVLKADVEAVSGHRPFSVVYATPTLFLANEGRDFAEDVYFEMELPDWDFEQRDDKENISTFLDVTDERTGYIGSPRGVYQVNVNKPIQPREEFKMFFGGVELERNRTYELNYTISCRSYGPREGSIKFHVGHHEINVENNYPRRRRKHLIRLREALSHQKTREANIEIPKLDVDWKSEKTANITALIKNTSAVRLSSAEVRFDLFLGKDNSGNYQTSIPCKIVGLDPGEFWQVDLEFELNQPKSSKDVSIEHSLSADTNHLVDGWERIKLVDSGGDTADDSHSVPQVYGRLENLNAGTSRTVRVVAKWIDQKGRVISTDDTKLELESGEAKDFRVNCSGGLEVVEKIDDYSIVLMGG